MRAAISPPTRTGPKVKVEQIRGWFINAEHATTIPRALLAREDLHSIFIEKATPKEGYNFTMMFIDREAEEA